jgi:Tol biopolymer transport system component
VYVRDIGSGAMHFLGNPTNSTRDPVFSANGRHVAYMVPDLSSFLTPWEPSVETIYRIDLRTKEKVLVAYPATRGTFIIYSGPPYQPPIAITSDGNLVAFLRQTPGRVLNVYVRDINTGTTNLISVNRNGTGVGNGTSTEPQFSPDGRWLLFRSAATDLTTNNSPGLFARDLAANTTIAINSKLAASTYRQTVAVSGNSQVVASLTTEGSVLLFNLQSRTSTVIFPSFFPSPVRSLSLDGTGRLLAYQAVIGGSPSFMIQVRDTVTGSNELISARQDNNGPANKDSSFPSISYDGRFVVFASDATDLVSDDNNKMRDVFVRDRLRQVTLLASINRRGTGSGNGLSTLPVLAADGRTVLFQSFASDLVEGDFNETGDVFVLSLRGPDTDGDGLDDDWEMAYFGNLSRDGAGDFDADGSSDATEFQLGTDPTNLGSVFQVLTVSRGAGTAKMVLWSATPGRHYRVQFKDSIAQAAWTEATDAVIAGGTTAVWTDQAPGAAHRFYRVVLLP